MAAQGNVQWTDPRFVQGFQIWKSLFDEGIMQEGAIGLNQYPDGNNLFLSLLDRVGASVSALGDSTGRLKSIDA